MLQLNPGPSFGFGSKSNLYFASSADVSYEFEITIQMPGEYETVGRIPTQHGPPIAFRAIFVFLIPTAATTRFYHRRDHGTSANMMFFGPPLAHVLSEYFEGAPDVSVYDDRFSNDGVFFGLLHCDLSGFWRDCFR